MIREHGYSTSVPSVRDKIQNQAETQHVPPTMVLNRIHEEEVLFQNVRVLRTQVDRRHVDPRQTRPVVIRLERTDFQQSANVSFAARSSDSEDHIEVLTYLNF